MTKNILILSISITLLLLCSCKVKSKVVNSDKIKFEISEYNLLFTKVEIGENEYAALIDFGDFADFQISTNLIAELQLETEKSEIIMSDINGNQYALEKGTIEELKVDGIIEKNVTFYSANNEIESVSQEVGTEFQIVVGFGYFKSKDFKLNFVSNTIEFVKSTNEKTDFSISVNDDYGYLIGEFQSITNGSFNLLFDTGTPISKIDLKLFPKNLKDSTVTFLDTEFPSKILEVKSTLKSIILNLEHNDISELEPLGVVGIYGVNDMLDKVFLYSSSERMMRIKTGNKR